MNSNQAKKPEQDSEKSSLNHTKNKDNRDLPQNNNINSNFDSRLDQSQNRSPIQHNNHLNHEVFRGDRLTPKAVSKEDYQEVRAEQIKSLNVTTSSDKNKRKHEESIDEFPEIKVESSDERESPPS